MAHNIGNKIGVSKEVGILDLYTVNVDNKADGAYAAFPGSQYSLQDGNAGMGGAHVVGGFKTDASENLQGKKGSGTYGVKYVGEPSNGHNAFDVFANKQIGEKPEPAKFYGD